MILAPFKRLRVVAADELSRIQDNVAEGFERVRDILNAGLRYDNRVGELVTVSVTAPDDWVPVTLANGWTRHSDFGFFAPSQRKTDDGRVFTRGLVERIAGVPVAGSTIFTTPYQASSRGRLQSNGATLDIFNVTPVIAWDGGTSISFLDPLQYDALDRSPAPWASPVAVPLSANFMTDVSAVEVVRAVETASGVSVSGVRARWVPTITRSVRGVSLLSLSGLVPLKTYSVTLFVAGT